MTTRFWACFWTLLAVPGPGSAVADVPASPTAAAVAAGVWVIPGGVLADRQPDGNSVIFSAPDGLVVVDTGRHAWHRDAILALARERKERIAAIVNTHWHLDHVSGNPGIRASYPALVVYASNAIDGALDGFLAQSARDSARYLDDPGIPLAMREDIRGDLATIEHGDALKPDVVVTTTGRVRLGGRTMELHLARDAVTAGDVWLYDASTRVAALGDLVTLPVPFLDTACPENWKIALTQVAAIPFEVAIPGHGGPMTRPQFEQYRRAFEAFVDCAHSERPAGDCASHWTDSVDALMPGGASETQRGRQFAEYYVTMLRANGGRSKYCQAATDPP